MLIASFNLSTNKPGSGEVIGVSGVTPDADIYTWTVDGQFYSNEKQPSFTFSPTGSTHTVRLDVKRKKDKSSAQTTVNVIAKGWVTFWQSSSQFSFPVNVTVGGVTRVITQGCFGAPACNQTGCASYYLDASGYYGWGATQQSPGTQSWVAGQGGLPYIITVTDGGCLLVQLP